jgi:hypothetical protein
VDLGSGVGQVCMLFAALSKAAMCFGIELMRHPARYADQLLRCFQSCCNKENVNLAPIKLVQGDFLSLENKELTEALSSAGLVFANNPRFGPELNLQLLSELSFSLCFYSVSLHSTDRICPLLPKGCKLVYPIFTFSQY